MKSQDTSLISTIPLHPLCLGLYPILMLYLINIQETVLFAISKSLVFSVILIAVVYLIVRIIFKSRKKAAAISSFLLISFFSYGHVYGILDNTSIFGGAIWRHRYFFPVWAGLIAGGVFFLAKSKSNFQGLTRILNIVSFLLFSTVLFQIGFYLLRVENIHPANNSQATSETQATSFVSDADGPDVYYIVLDSYSRQDFLREQYHLENSDFIHELEMIGFVVPDCTQSNYAFTTLSLSSSLNMNYLDRLGISLDPNAARIDVPDLLPLIKHGLVRQSFEQLGYQTITFKTVYPYLDIMDSTYYYDFYQSATSLSKQETSNFYYLFLRTTALRPVTEYLELHPQIFDKLPEVLREWLPSNSMLSNRNFRQYQQNVFLLDTLEQIPELPGKKFIYAHLFTTHQPFVFNADGSFRGLIINNDAAYYDQIVYTNKRIIEILTTIIQNSRQVPIIIIQGDHGIPWTTERVEILNAYYLPKGGSEALYPEITPVNTFRVVFNQYFGGNYELLPDTSYYSDQEKPYEFTVIPPSCVEESN